MLDREDVTGRDPAPGLDAPPTVKVTEDLARVAAAGLAPAADVGRSEFRGTVVEAIQDVAQRTGSVGFVSAGLAGQERPRVLEPQELVAAIERAESSLGPAAERRPVYTIGEGGAIVNTVTGRTEYVPVHTEAGKADLEKAHVAAPVVGTPGEGARAPDAAPLQGAQPPPAVPIDERIYAPRGGAPREVARHSHYNDPIQHPDGEPSGISRRYGDADRDTQRRCMDLVIEKGRERGMSDHEIALTLAITRVESGFNPDAAAGSTSASGLGQFIDRTGRPYGLDAGNRWNAGAQADALVRHTQDNMALARSRGHGGADLDRYTYAYHHDGPSLAYGGLALADRHVVPRIAMYEEYVRNHR